MCRCSIGDGRRRYFQIRTIFVLKDKQLIGKLRQGNRGALQEIYHLYRDDLLRLAASLLCQNQLAEDVVHDVFVSFVQSADEFKLTGSLKGYLLTCVANLSRDKVRAKKRAPTRKARSSSVPLTNVLKCISSIVLE